MSKTKTIAEQIEELERENARLIELDKLFEKAIKSEFNMDRKTLHKIVDEYNRRQQGQFIFFAEKLNVRGAAPYHFRTARSREKMTAKVDRK